MYVIPIEDLRLNILVNFILPIVIIAGACVYDHLKERKKERKKASGDKSKGKVSKK